MIAKDKEYLGAILKAVRKHKNISQKDIADMMGIAPNAVCDIEAGRKGVSLERLSEICNYIGVKPSQIFLLLENGQTCDYNKKQLICDIKKIIF